MLTVYVSVCMFVCEQENSNSSEQISINYSGWTTNTGADSG